MQQSPALGAPAIQSWQLLLPHTNPAWQWESLSQSPWPRLQGALELQKLQSQDDPVPEPGQHWVLQRRVCVLSPLQFLPPLAGAGLSQLLLRLLLPPPQLALQADQALQLPQPPFTG